MGFLAMDRCAFDVASSALQNTSVSRVLGPCAARGAETARRGVHSSSARFFPFLAKGAAAASESSAILYGPKIFRRDFENIIQNIRAFQGFQYVLPKRTEMDERASNP